MVKSNVRIQERDIEIFDWLYKFRFLTVQQIAGLVESVEIKTAKPEYQFKGGYDAIVKRVKLLTDADYLRCFTDISSKYVYSLGPRAIDNLVLAKGIAKEEIDHILEQKKRGEQHLKHFLMIAEFGATLAIAIKQRPDIQLITWLPESIDRQIEVVIPERDLTDEMKKWKKRREDYNLTLKRKPDAIFGLQSPKGQAFFILEADRGTESIKIFMQKMATYYHFLAQDKFKDWSVENFIHPEGKAISKFRVITYTVTQLWQDALIKNTLRITPDQIGSRMFWFVSQKFYSHEKILGDIFSIAHANEIDKLFNLL
jgi:hypothetical protein